MTLLAFLILSLIAGICDAIVLAIVGFRGDILVSIAIGFISALIGMLLSRAPGLREMLAVNVGGKTFQYIWSIIGATPFVFLIGLFGDDVSPPTPICHCIKSVATMFELAGDEQ
jgi:uncharacterized membrane protein YeaQ/YmgE (transglycosylase-associated protein family)